MRLGFPQSLALITATYGILGWTFARLSVGIVLVGIDRLRDGNLWACLLIPAAAASLLVSAAALRQLGAALTK